MNLLRRNVIALLLIAILASGFINWIVLPRYRVYANVNHPTPDIVVAVGQMVDLHGIRWRVKDVLHETKSRSSFTKGASVPSGTEALRVLWDRAPVNGQSSEPPQCGGAALIAGATQWKSEPTGDYVVVRNGVTSTINIAIGPRGTTSACSEPDIYGSAFLVPKGTQPDAVDLAIRWADPQSLQVVRFRLS